MAIAGKVAITPKGEWNANTTYEKLDLVFYENASYVAIQPSTDVLPTDESFWMLVVQSAGGADLDAIINGTTQVGNAKTLDGHEAEYFAPLADLAKYLPLKGGTLTETTSYSPLFLKTTLANNTQNIIVTGYGVGDETMGYLGFKGKGNLVIQEPTSWKWYDILHTGNMASHVLPITGGTVTSASNVPVVFNSANANPNVLRFQRNGANLGHIGFSGTDEPVFVNGAGNTVKQLLHTGNKPTGTYTGNGDATSRTISTGGTGLGCLIKGNGYGFLATFSGGICFGSSSLTYIPGLKFQYGSLIIETDTLVNVSGKEYTYDVI